MRYRLEKKITSGDKHQITFVISSKEDLSFVLKPEFDVEFFNLIGKHLNITKIKDEENKI